MTATKIQIPAKDLVSAALKGGPEHFFLKSLENASRVCSENTQEQNIVNDDRLFLILGTSRSSSGDTIPVVYIEYDFWREIKGRLLSISPRSDIASDIKLVDNFIIKAVYRYLGYKARSVFIMDWSRATSNLKPNEDVS